MNLSLHIRIVLTLCSIILQPCFVQGRSPVGRALVIGLGEQEDPTWAKIHGDNDVRYVVSFLESLGYTDIKKITNKEATKVGIVNEFQGLASRCKTGDKVYVHYSGHGQLMTDLNGDEALKWDGRNAQWDQSWIPYDAYMNYCEKDRGEKHLCDDELAVLLSSIRKEIGRTGELIVVVDSCHSGDSTSGLNSHNSRNSNNSTEVTEQECIRGVSVKFNIPRTSDLPQSPSVTEQWLTISACRPYELSTEIKSLQVGKLTYALYKLGGKVLNQKRSDMENTLSGFLKKHEGRTPQNPMVTGRK